MYNLKGSTIMFRSTQTKHRPFWAFEGCAFSWEDLSRKEMDKKGGV